MSRALIILILVLSYSCKPDSKKDLRIGQEEDPVSDTEKTKRLAETNIDTIAEAKDSW
jgi:uncharacterized Ntn-hydrolase superfamily protein